MNPDEAREEAWREFRDSQLSLNTHYMNGGTLALLESTYARAWDARGRYDEQRIAEALRLLSLVTANLEGCIRTSMRVREDTLLIKLNEVARALGQSEVKP